MSRAGESRYRLLETFRFRKKAETRWWSTWTRWSRSVFLWILHHLPWEGLPTKSIQRKYRRKNAIYSDWYGFSSVIICPGAITGFMKQSLPGTLEEDETLARTLFSWKKRGGKSPSGLFLGRHRSFLHFSALLLPEMDPEVLSDQVTAWKPWSRTNTATESDPLLCRLDLGDGQVTVVEDQVFSHYIELTGLRVIQEELENRSRLRWGSKNFLFGSLPLLKHFSLNRWSCFPWSTTRSVAGDRADWKVGLQLDIGKEEMDGLFLGTADWEVQETKELYDLMLQATERPLSERTYQGPGTVDKHRQEHRPGHLCLPGEESSCQSDQGPALQYPPQCFFGWPPKHDEWNPGSLEQTTSPILVYLLQPDFAVVFRADPDPFKKWSRPSRPSKPPESLGKAGNVLKSRNPENPWSGCVASAGEWLQAQPVIRRLSEKEVQCVLTYTSINERWETDGNPSRISGPWVHSTGPRQCEKLLDLMAPDKIVWVSYDLWPNHVWEAATVESRSCSSQGSSTRPRHAARISSPKNSTGPSTTGLSRSCSSRMDLERVRQVVPEHRGSRWWETPVSTASSNAGTNSILRNGPRNSAEGPSSWQAAPGPGMRMHLPGFAGSWAISRIAAGARPPWTHRNLLHAETFFQEIPMVRWKNRTKPRRDCGSCSSTPSAFSWGLYRGANIAYVGAGFLPVFTTRWNRPRWAARHLRPALRQCSGSQRNVELGCAFSIDTTENFESRFLPSCRIQNWPENLEFRPNGSSNPAHSSEKCYRRFSVIFKNSYTKLSLPKSKLMKWIYGERTNRRQIIWVEWPLKMERSFSKHPPGQSCPPINNIY